MGPLPAAEEQRFKADSICIVGAGPSGIAAAKYLRAEGGFSRIVVFEQRSTTGGLWNYIPWNEHWPSDLSVPQTNAHAGLDRPIWTSEDGSRNDGQGNQEASFTTPVYERLETNIPRGLMGFSDLNWPQDCQLFPKHKQVLDYIQQYGRDIEHLIEFRTQVLDICPSPSKQWLVKTRSVNQTSENTIQEYIFNAVIVANGHYAVPHIPLVPGIEAWHKIYPGTITHSKMYRKPENYTDKKVIVVGNAASGSDIGAQIAMTCRWPLLVSQRSESFLLSDPSPSKQEKPEIAEYVAEDRSVRFVDGTVERDVDAVLYCTGYLYSYPFLNSLDPPVVTTGKRVENLYQHIFYRPHPTLSFLTLNQRIIPFPVAEAQSAVIAKVLSGKLTLPSERKMETWEQEVVEEMGTGKDFHVLQFPKDAEYVNMLHDWALSGMENGGKTPPFWGEKEFWTRERFPMIKKAFADFGEGRHQKRALEELGYDFEQWKKERDHEEQKLL